MFNEFLQGVDLKTRANAALLLGMLRCRRGLRTLEAVLGEYDARFRALGGSVNPHDPSIRDQSFYLYNVLFAVACMDTPQAHATLVRVAQTFPYEETRADAILNMRFEDEVFDPDFVLPYLDPTGPVPYILNALYALEYREYPRKKSNDIRERTVRLLQHANPHVRSSAVRNLSHSRANHRFLRQLLDDPVEGVREAVREALEESA